MKLKKLELTLASACLVTTAMVFVPGCERKERVIDIETPHGKVKVERDKKTGDVNVDVSRDKRDPSERSDR